MRRREFITLSAVRGRRAAARRAHSSRAMPVIGFLRPGSPEAKAHPWRHRQDRGKPVMLRAERGHRIQMGAQL